MKRTIPAIAAALLISSAAFAQTETTTTTTWTNEYGDIIREESVTRKFEPIVDPQIDVKVGSTLPQTITVHPLPGSIRVEQPDRYAYVIINDDPVVIDKQSRRVVHVWNR